MFQLIGTWGRRIDEFTKTTKVFYLNTNMHIQSEKFSLGRGFRRIFSVDKLLKEGLTSQVVIRDFFCIASVQLKNACCVRGVCTLQHK